MRAPVEGSAPFGAESLGGLGGAGLRALYEQRFGMPTASSNLSWLRKALSRTFPGDPDPV